MHVALGPSAREERAPEIRRERKQQPKLRIERHNDAATNMAQSALAMLSNDAE